MGGPELGSPNGVAAVPQPTAAAEMGALGQAPSPRAEAGQHPASSPLLPGSPPRRPLPTSPRPSANGRRRAGSAARGGGREAGRRGGGGPGSPGEAPEGARR